MFLSQTFPQHAETFERTIPNSGIRFSRILNILEGENPLRSLSLSVVWPWSTLEDTFSRLSLVKSLGSTWQNIASRIVVNIDEQWAFYVPRRWRALPPVAQGSSTKTKENHPRRTLLFSYRKNCCVTRFSQSFDDIALLLSTPIQTHFNDLKRVVSNILNRMNSIKNTNGDSVISKSHAKTFR